uniref:alpha/beta fold hydrolase n=2 Tax=unclassified Streptomyces TaxID=2593676 RepID=UPI0021565E21
MTAPPRPATGEATGTLLAAGEWRLRTDDGATLALSVLDPLPGSSRATPGAEPPTVVLVHGWAAGRRVWGVVADRLIRSGHRVVSYDQRGHGASDTGDDGAPGITVDRLAADLAQVVTATATPGAILAGHSGGGFAALRLASGTDHTPARQRLGGLVLLATAAHDQDTPDSEVRMMGSAHFTRALRRPRLGRTLLRQTVGADADTPLRETNRQLFAATDPAVRAACFRSSRGMDLRAALERVTLPARVLAGDADRVIAPALGRVLAQSLPDAEWDQLPGAGHMLPLERPLPVVRAVTEL